GIVEDQGIVGYAIDRRAQDLACMCERGLDAGIHLRHAAQRIRVLNAIAVLVRAVNRAFGEQQAKTPRDFDLVRGSTRFMYASVEWRVTARKPIDRERARDDRGCEHGFRSKKPVERERQAQLSSIDERETFFCLERDRCEARRIAYGSTFEALIAAERLAFADQAQRDVRERSEVAGCADRAAR